jgi:hypothetical protein
MLSSKSLAQPFDPMLPAIRPVESSSLKFSPADFMVQGIHGFVYLHFCRSKEHLHGNMLPFEDFL